MVTTICVADLYHDKDDKDRDDEDDHEKDHHNDDNLSDYQSQSPTSAPPHLK